VASEKQIRKVSFIMMINFTFSRARQYLRCLTRDPPCRVHDSDCEPHVQLFSDKPYGDRHANLAVYT